MCVLAEYEDTDHYLLPTGVLIYLHHDVNGASTWILSMDGIKLWVLINPKPQHLSKWCEQWAEKMLNITLFEEYEKHMPFLYGGKCDIEVLDICPSDLI